MIPVLTNLGLAFLIFSLTGFSQPDTSDYSDFFESGQFLRAPFQEGEQLSYEVNWKPLFAIPAFKAGDVTMRIERSHMSGVETYKISAWARSDGALSEVAGFEVKNYFESQIDRLNYRSYRIFQKIRQGKRKRNLELRFDYEQNQTSILETDQSISPPRQIRNRIVKSIPGPVTDLLSIFYIARLRSVHPGDRFQLHLNEKGKFKKVLVEVEKEETVLTPVGTFPSIKLTTMGGIFKDGGEFRIWYSTDNLRVPVKFEADVKIGKVYGNLVKLETPRQTRSVIRVK